MYKMCNCLSSLYFYIAYSWARLQNCEKRLLRRILVIPLPLFICLSASNNLAPTGRIFMKFNIWEFFSKICPGNKSLLKIWQEWWGSLHLCLADFILNWGMFRTKTHRKSKHTFYVQWLSLRKSFHLWDNVGKYVRCRHPTDDNTIRRKKKN